MATLSDNNGYPPASVWMPDSLRRFAQRREPVPPPLERCELCSAPLAAEHRHLLDLSNKALSCACDACATLFSERGAGGRVYRLVPTRCLALPAFQMTDEQWDELLIPVEIAFLLRSAGEKPVLAFYPSPAGATESLLSLEGWAALAQSNPLLNELEPDVEALLINRVKDRREYYVVPIDACYQLVGLIRLSWRGLSGGEEVWKAIDAFFADLRAKANVWEGGNDARPEL